MSNRNYYRGVGPLGNIRRPVEIPAFVPEVDTDGLLEVDAWRVTIYKKPIVDNLMGFYRFDPATVRGALNYVKPSAPKYPTGEKAVGKEAVLSLIAQKKEAEATAQRQSFHIAETTERALAVFWSVATVRYAVLGQALNAVTDEKAIPEDVGNYAADAIVDTGLCLEEPFENDWKFKVKKNTPLSKGLKMQIDKNAPNIGTQVASFGAFAVANHEALRSYDGIVIMQSAYEEQEFRISTWRSRHLALTEAIPELPVSDEILYQRMPMEEMLSIHNNPGNLS